MSNLRQFDPKDWLMIYGGHLIDEVDADFLSVEPDTDNFSMVRGIDGDSARVRNTYNGGRITIRLLQSSDSNGYLSAYATADYLSGLATLPFFAKERSDRGSFIFAPSAWILRKPNLTFSNSVKSREWVFMAQTIISYVAGNELANGDDARAKLLGLTTLPRWVRDRL